MVLDRPRREHQAIGQLGRGQAIGQQQQDVELRGWSGCPTLSLEAARGRRGKKLQAALAAGPQDGLDGRCGTQALEDAHARCAAVRSASSPRAYACQSGECSDSQARAASTPLPASMSEKGSAGETPVPPSTSRPARLRHHASSPNTQGSGCCATRACACSVRSAISADLPASQAASAAAQAAGAIRCSSPVAAARRAARPSSSAASLPAGP